MKTRGYDLGSGEVVTPRGCPCKIGWRKTGRAVLMKIALSLCILLGLMAIGFGVYEFVHNEISNGSLSFLFGVVILNFAINGTGAFGD